MFPKRGVEIIQALYHASPQDDAARRVDIQKVGEQMAFELGPRWGNKKRAGLSDDFRSPDSIAYDDITIGRIHVWDIQASSGQILVHEGKEPDHPNLSPGEAAFMPCAPVNHMGAAPPEEPSGPSGPPSGGGQQPPVDLGPVLAELVSMKSEVVSLKSLVQFLLDRPAPTPSVEFPAYEGELDLGWAGRRRVLLKPIED